ncbi:MAG TPA: hypothetical protein VLC11_04635 [Gemmatimonadales bacterium]|nr:hypothetical protein [Gemmatimonadales bacterium]
MSLDPELRALYAQSVTVKPWSRDDAFGAPVYGTAVVYEARVEALNKLIKDMKGRDTIATSRVFVGLSAAGAALNLGPQAARASITLPDGSSPSILSVSNVPDETGQPYATVVYCG